MAANTTLQKRILRLVSVTLLAVSVAILIAVWFSTDRHLRDQINADLSVGSSVLERLMTVREQQLVNSAEILTADFGFKQAVASSDTATINSVLANHGKRIGADLMALVSLDGVINASSVDDLIVGQPLSQKDLLEKAIREGGAISFFRIDQSIYQVILLPIKAPVTIGVAAIGFRVNNTLVEELHEVTHLDVSFVSEKRNDRALTLSSLDANNLELVLDNVSKEIPFRLPLMKRNIYSTLTLTLAESEQERIRVFLSASVDQAYAEFDVLKFEIFNISIVAILLSLFVGSIFARNISSPLKSLADVARGLATGDYKQEVNIKKSSQEINDLVSAFKTMQADLGEREARIIYQSVHDPLTGLYNRQCAVDMITVAIEKDPDRRWLVTGLNIKDFRVVNDTFGHATGDACLQQIAQRLQTLADQNRFCARLAGDEFLVFEELTTSVVDHLTKISGMLESPFKDRTLDISLSFTFGTAQYPRDALTAVDLLHKADVALDITRRQKRDIFHYEPGIEEARVKRLQLINDLKTAIALDDGQLRMYFQPKVYVRDGSPSRFEALIRWIHPSQGFIPPDHFIPLAEQSGLISTLTDWVVCAVIKQLASWYQMGMFVQVAVNFSAQDVARPQLLENIIAQLESFKLPRDCLSIEITESDIMNEPEKAIAQLNCYREHGFHIAIDDFGTGYSSLSQLKNMPVTELKIDKSFILHLDKNENDQIIVRSTIELAHRFELEVVAEGVENQATLALLSQWGCEWIQGYYFSKPLPAADVAKWVNDYRQSSKVISMR